MVFGIADLGEAVDQRADEAQVLHTALQLPGRHIGVLHRQRRERPEAIGPLADHLGEEIVGLAGERVGLLGIGDGLDRRRVERQDHHLHAVLIHLAQAASIQIDQPAAKLLPDGVGEKSFRVIDGVVDREVLFEPDLALHGVLSPFSVIILIATPQKTKAAHVRRLLRRLVEPGGIEPPTS